MYHPKTTENPDPCDEVEWTTDLNIVRDEAEKHAEIGADELRSRWPEPTTVRIELEDRVIAVLELDELSLQESGVCLVHGKDWFVKGSAMWVSKRGVSSATP